MPSSYLQKLTKFSGEEFNRPATPPYNTLDDGFESEPDETKIEEAVEEYKNLMITQELLNEQQLIQF